MVRLYGSIQFLCGIEIRVSGTGQLPYLTHGTTNISTFESIVDYFARLKRPLDEDLTEKQ